MDLSKIKEWLSTDKAKQIGIVALAAILLVTFSVVLKSCYDKDVIDDHETEVKAEVLEKKSEADSKAAEARASDTIVQKEKEQKREEAIAKATDEAPSDPERQLGCQRLREQGYDTARIPACN